MKGELDKAGFLYKKRGRGGGASKLGQSLVELKKETCMQRLNQDQPILRNIGKCARVYTHTCNTVVNTRRAKTCPCNVYTPSNPHFCILLNWKI